MTVEEALIIVDSILKPGYLNHVQELVLRQSWEGRTYPEMAASSCYDAEYIKNIGYHLWQSLSEKLGEKVTKSNFRSVLRRYIFTKDRGNGSFSPTSPKEQAEIYESNGISFADEADWVKSQKSNQQVFPLVEFADRDFSQPDLFLEENGWNQGNYPDRPAFCSLPGNITENELYRLTAEKEWEKQKAVERESTIELDLYFRRLQVKNCQLPITDSPKTVNLRQDWEKTLDVSVFYGRASELANLEQWILAEGCRLVAILGMGGIGKTALSLKLAENISQGFEYSIWRSLRNAPPLSQLLSDLLRFVSAGKFVDESATVEEKIQRLMTHLQTHRCLLILDGVEAILQSGEVAARAGYYREGYESYGELFARVGEEAHHSCLLLTSREQPKELAFLIGRKVRSLHLQGLSHSAAQEIFKEKGCFGEAEIWLEVTKMYQGNPLALKIASTTIKDLFDGNVAEFVSQNTTVYGNVRDLLTQQFERLSETEKEIMYWLTAEKEAMSLQELRQNLKSNLSSIGLLESLESLKGRSLIETKSGYFTQQLVVKEYVKNRLLPSNKISDGGEISVKKLLINKNSVLRM